MKRSLLISFLFSLLIACSSQPRVNIDFNPDTHFQQLTSYQFSPVTDVSVDANPIMIHRIQTAIDTRLAQKGLKKHTFVDKSSADISIQVSFNQQEKQRNPSFSIGLGTSRVGGSSSANIGLNTRIPINSEADIVTQIIIDMSDKNQAIWHGSASYEAKESLSIEQLNQVVKTKVNELLAHFPPKTIEK